MKAKIILYGWVFSLLPMMAGIGTMEWAMETDDRVFIPGLLLFMIFVLFSSLVIKNRDIVDEEVKRFDLLFDRVFDKINRWFSID